MRNVSSYIVFRDSVGEVIPGLTITLDDGTNQYSTTYSSGRYIFSVPPGTYDVKSGSTVVISNFFVPVQLILRQWCVPNLTLTDGQAYTFSSLTDVYGDSLPSSVPNPKVWIANNVGTRSVSFKNITDSGFEIKLGDSGSPATVVADLFVTQLNL